MSAGGVVSFSVDLDANTFNIRYNNSSILSGTIGGTAGRKLWPFHMSYHATDRKITANFGQRSFKYTPPSGYKALCTQNLPDTFSGAAKNDPSKYFDAKTYDGTGNSTTNTITGVGFQPDLLWFRKRNVGSNHVLYDAIRGTSNALRPNNSDSQSAFGNAVVTPTSTGFTITGSDTNGINDSGTYISWLWDAGTAQAASGTYGSNSKTYSRWTNATAGLSIIQWDADATSGASGLVVPHGLGTVPEVLIYKPYDTGSTSWYVMTTAIDGSWDQLTFSTGQSSAAAYTGADNNYIQNQGYSVSENVMCYAFSEIPGFSSFGTYSANGSASGPFVYTGMKPKLIMFKAIDASSSWTILDRARDPMNPTTNRIFLDTGTDAESSGTNGNVDFISNGFKIRTSHVGINDSGKTYFYAAWAESPFKTVRAE